MENPDDVSLKLFCRSQLLYTSRKKWLYPLFDLEEFLKTQNFESASLILEDKIIGKAAAFLVIRLGITKVRAHLLSRPGKGVFDKHRINYSFDQLVDKILCKTEDLLRDINDPDTAYKIIRARINS
ncbi:MAG: DUF1893 domain-containing protein [Spirochaetes bacterium]|nr:DUF1893 domain-containing protein [Spirochaetota bacterium]